MISVVLFVVHSLLHPFHVSVSEVKYKPEKKAIQISVRIFLDDLEVAMQAYSGNETLDITLKDNWTFINENLGTYLPENLKVYSERGQLEANYLGAEIDGEVMWAYMEIEKVKKLKIITIWNSLLHETFDDQENLIHFRAFDKVKSARLFKGDEQQV
ncbi:MAG: DUF6702 family protein, partial [Cyclobacteriaceae bacterium]